MKPTLTKPSCPLAGVVTSTTSTRSVSRGRHLSALLALAAVLGSTQSASAAKATGVVARITTYVSSGSQFVSIAGYSDKEGNTPDNGTVDDFTSTAYQCDRPGANLDLPYLDLNSAHADVASSALLAAYLSGKEIYIEYGADCKISIVSSQ